MDSSFSQVSFARLSPTDSSRTEENWSLSPKKCWGMERKFSRKLVSKGEGFRHGFLWISNIFFLTSPYSLLEFSFLGNTRGSPRISKSWSADFWRKCGPELMVLPHCIWCGSIPFTDEWFASPSSKVLCPKTHVEQGGYLKGAPSL